MVPGDSLRGSSFSIGGGGRSAGAALNGVGIAPILASLLGGSSLPTKDRKPVTPSAPLLATFLWNVMSVHLEKSLSCCQIK